MCFIVFYFIQLSYFMFSIRCVLIWYLVWFCYESTPQGRLAEFEQRKQHLFSLFKSKKYFPGRQNDPTPCTVAVLCTHLEVSSSHVWQTNWHDWTITETKKFARIMVGQLLLHRSHFKQAAMKAGNAAIEMGRPAHFFTSLALQRSAWCASSIMASYSKHN